MKTDSEEFKKLVEEARGRDKRLDELRIVVIKWHLLVEQALDIMLTSAVFNPEGLEIDGMKFHPKGQLAVALSLKEDKDPIWNVFWALNQLRNKIAHNVEQKIVDEKVNYLRKAYVASSDPSQRAEAEKLKDGELVKEASAWVIGFLSHLTMDAKDRRGILDKHWKSRSEGG